MPPKTTVTKEQIIEAGLDIVRITDITHLTARQVAQNIGCSTQPVYRLFSSMDALREAVFDRMLALEQRYLTEDGNNTLPPMFQVGLGALRFAQQEPGLANALALFRPRLSNMLHNRLPPFFVLEKMRTDPDLQGLSDSQLSRIQAQLWFFIQGLIILFRAEGGNRPETMEQAIGHLKAAGAAFIQFEQQNKKKGEMK